MPNFIIRFRINAESMDEAYELLDEQIKDKINEVDTVAPLIDQIDEESPELSQAQLLLVLETLIQSAKEVPRKELEEIHKIIKILQNKLN